MGELGTLHFSTASPIFRHIQSAIERASKERTSLIVAHRLSTIVRAEQIVVMDQVESPCVILVTKVVKWL